MTALCVGVVAVSQAVQPLQSASAWLRDSYSNSIRSGGVGIGLGVMRRDGDRAAHALVIEASALRPVRLRESPGLRAFSEERELFELAPSADPWKIDSSMGATIKGSTVHSARMAFPLTEAQLEQLLAAGKPMLQITHAEGKAELRLSRGETKDLASFVRSP